MVSKTVFHLYQFFRKMYGNVPIYYLITRNTHNFNTHNKKYTLELHISFLENIYFIAKAIQKYPSIIIFILQTKN